MRKTGPLAILLAVVAVLPFIYGEISAEPSAAPVFHETFEGMPPHPQTFYNVPGWDVAMNLGDDPESMRDMWIQHGPNCEGPPNIHHGNHWTNTVFICNNHLMTAIKQGYGSIYLTPGVLADFSDGEAVIRFDVSSLRTSNRDWTDVWITPIEHNLMHPLEDWQAFLTGYPRHSVQLKGGENVVVRDFQKSTIKTRCCPTFSQALSSAGLDPSPTRRDTYEIRITRTNISYCLKLPENDEYCRVNNAEFDPPLTWDRGIVQIGHHTYDATKGTTSHDCSLAGLEHQCPDANTWHWDNVYVSPAVPFGIIHSDPRFFREDGKWEFQSPAPDGAYLRFRAQSDGGNTEISVNGGATWQPAQYQVGSKLALGKDNCTQPCNGNVWHPVPQGTTEVLVRGNGAYSDATIWSLEGGSLAPGPMPGFLAWGDVDCDGKMGMGDALKIARHLVDLPISQTQPCQALGSHLHVTGALHMWGDLDCDGSVAISDALNLARALIGKPVSQGSPCPKIGVQVAVGQGE